MFKISLRQPALIALIMVSLGRCILAQSTDPAAVPTDPADKPRAAASEPNNAYKRWVEDVTYIITGAEREAFLKLKTNDERDNFIAAFWNRRNPDPDSEVNQYREAYYERVAYANEHFASGIPGWRTDRGRIYITWGKPDEVESHPSGGDYDRPSYEGGGRTTTYPFETWIYRHLDDVGDGVEVEFVDPSGSGEYHIAQSPDEKDALLNIPGAGQTTAEELGLASKATRISGIGSGLGYSYQREQDTPFRRQEIIKGLMTPPAVKFSDLGGSSADSGVIDNNSLPFDVRVDFFRQSDDQVITAFTVQTSNRDLKFDQVGGLETAQINIFGRITAVSEKRSGMFEDSVTTNATAAELSDAMNRKSIYQRAVALSPGHYKVDVVVRDVKTGNKGLVNLAFEVPRYDATKLSTSSLILTSKLRPTDESDIGQRFVIGNAKVIPNLGGTYKRGQEVGVYLQVYNAQIDQTTLRPSVEVTYVLSKDGKELLSQPEDWSGLSDASQRLTLARLLPTTELGVGDYEIKVLIHDRVTGAAIEDKGKFSIVP